MTRFLAAVLFAATVAPATAFASFPDVPKTHPHVRAIETLQALGVIVGKDSGSFGASDPVTRVEYLKMLHKALNRSPDNVFTDDEALLPFDDVPAGSWYEPYVRSAYQRGFINGFGDRTFRPNGAVTLFQATKMLEGLEFESLGGIASRFPTNDLPEAEKEATRFLTTHNLLSAASLHTSILRGDVAELLYRWIVVKKTGTTPYAPALDSKLAIVPIAVPVDGLPGFEALKEALDILEANYLHGDRVRDEGTFEYAAKGIVEGVADPYSEYYTAEESSQFFEMLENESVGIGVFLTLDDDALTVVRVLPGTPAAAAGLEVGDAVTVIDGLKVSDDPLAAFFYLVGQTQVGQKISLTVRKISGGTVDIDVALARITQPSVEVEMLGNDILLIRIWQFATSTDAELIEALTPFQGQEFAGILLDLRDNPGGYLSTTWEIGSHFLPEGATLAIMVNDQQETITTIDATGPFADVPIVVLVNGGSASAAEILAAALSEYLDATLVGETTYGKGTAQALAGIGTGGLLRFTVARWLTPSGKSVEGVGIKPDAEVLYDYSAEEAGTDTQFDAALKILRTKIAS